jgi:hypothetical protein
MRLALLAFLVVVSLSGCARLSTPTAVSKAVPAPAERLLAFQDRKADAGAIIVVRDEGFFGGRCFHGIWLNGVLAARLEPAEKATFYVEPGDYILTVGNVGTGSSACDAHKDRIHRETTIRTGQQKLFRALWNANDGIPDIQPYIGQLN